MATETAPAPPVAAPRNYWQLPVFVLGVAAAAAAWTYVPAPAADPAAAARLTLDDLARAVEKRPADPAAVEGLTRRVADAADRSPADPDRAHFLAGSGFVVLAEVGPPDVAADHWKAAVGQFTRCDPGKLAADDGKKLAYRSAKAAAALGTGDPALVLAALNQPPAGEDSVESARLVADTCLRLAPPDLSRAKQELTRYLSLPNRAAPADAARYKLTLAGLLFKAGEPDQARRWLADIGAGAPPEVLATAKVQLARLAASESNWAEAAKLFEAAQTVPGLPDDQKGLIRYQTGFALLRSGSPAQAGPYLEQAAKEPGAVGAAAAVRLAELQARDPRLKGRRADAAAWLDKAAAGVKGADDFQAATTADPAEVRAAFEEVIKRCLAEADFAAAVRSATAYAVVAVAGKDKERRAEANAAWAAELEKANPADAKPKYKAAAADYAAVAATAPTPAGQAEALKRAVRHFRQAGATGEALDAVNVLLRLKDLPAEDAGQAWLDKAELLPPAETTTVTEALQKAMASPGPAAAAARLRLAMHHLTRGRQVLEAAPGAADPAKAKQSGEQMVKLGRQMLVQIADAQTVAPGERAAHEEAVFQLGSQLMSEGQFADAEARFRKQTQLYPDGKLAGYARLWLACCLVQQGHTGGPADKRLQEAIDLLSPLLGSPVEFLRTQAEIRTLNTLVVQQRYDAVVKLGGELAQRYKGRPDELVIGKLMFYSYLNRTPAEPGEALRVLLRMEEAFKEIPSAAFPADPEYSHARWQKELPALRVELEKRKQ